MNGTVWIPVCTGMTKKERFQTVPYMIKNANYSTQLKLRTTKEKLFHLTGLKTRTTTERDKKKTGLKPFPTWILLGQQAV
jgi:hypothetical protein